jgi:hypothetical protein
MNLKLEEAVKFYFASEDEQLQLFRLKENLMTVKRSS